MKLAILTSRFPYPLEKGDKLRAYYQIRELSRWCDITLIALSEQPVLPAHVEHMQTFCRRIEVLPLQRWRIAFNLLRGWLAGLPLQVAYFYAPNLRHRMAKLLSEAQPAQVYCQLVRMAPYAEHLPYAKTLDYMDAFSAGAQRRATRAWQPLRQLWQLEAQRLRKYEAAVFEKFDHCTIISSQDRDLLLVADKTRLRVAPNGVDTVFFSPQSEVQKAYHIAFVGNMGYHPNVEAAKFLAQQVLPLLQKSRSDVKILIAGARPSAEVRRLQSEQVIVSGWVEDIRTAYQAAQVLVAPIFLGSGQQNKILEAMSMQLPCITTPMVNNAIGAPVNKAIRLAENAADFAEQILDLLADADERRAMGIAARTFVEQNYSWQRSTGVFTELFAKKSQENDF